MLVHACFEHDIGVLTKNFLLDFIPLCLLHLVVRIKFEEVKIVFSFEIIVEANIVRDFVLLFK